MQLELAYFEDISPLNEQVFSFPFVGRLSLRQIGLVGFGAMLAYLLFSTTGSILSLIPLGFFGFVAFRRFNVLPTELIILKLLRFTPFAEKQTQGKKKTKDKTASSLYKASEYAPGLHVVGKEIHARPVRCELGKPLRFQIRLNDANGNPLGSKKTRIEYDGAVIGTAITTTGGELEAMLIPEADGKKRISVYIDDSKEPAFEEDLLINV